MVASTDIIQRLAHALQIKRWKIFQSSEKLKDISSKNRKNIDLSDGFVYEFAEISLRGTMTVIRLLSQ